jgi:hypothetical protein
MKAGHRQIVINPMFQVASISDLSSSSMRIT